MVSLFTIQENSQIFLNFKTYNLNWCGNIRDLRLLLEQKPSVLQKERHNTYFYIKNERKISISYSEILFDSKHAQLQWVLRNGNEYCIVKRLKNVASNSLYRESILQILVYNCLAHFNLKKIVPKVFDIFEHHGQIVFTMEAFPKAMLFSDYLLENFGKNSSCFIEILAQIALYMIPLQNVLFFNHRDLKSDNILIMEEPTQHVLLFRGRQYTVRCGARALLVDFGFGCLGFEMGGVSLLNAGSVLPSIDACPKEGRDIFQILTSLYSFEKFRENLSPGLKALFDKWLTINGRHYSEKTVQNAENEEWIYSVTSGSFFSAPGCSPSTVLADIAEYYPEIVAVV